MPSYGSLGCVMDRPLKSFCAVIRTGGGVSSCDTGRDIGRVLTQAMLDRLSQRGGVCILYTHLGKIDDHKKPLDESAVAGFQRLAQAHRDQKILVTTTRRLLGFQRALRDISFETSRASNCVVIGLKTATDDAHPHDKLTEHDLAGLTFYVSNPLRTRVELDGQEIKNLHRNAADETGRESVSIPFPPLEFPDF